MDFLLVVSICLVLAWSAYSIMHSRKKAEKKALLFYSELIPNMEQYEFSKSTTMFPVLSGIFKGYRVKFVPEVDSLVFQRLPRLYLRMYIYVPNTVLFRLRLLDFDSQSNHLFVPNSFEKTHREVQLHEQQYRLFLGDDDYPLNLEDSLRRLIPAGDRCAEMLFQKNFVRVAILLDKGNKSAYIINRTVDFSDIVFRMEFFLTYFQAILELNKELNKELSGGD